MTSGAPPALGEAPIIPEGRSALITILKEPTQLGINLWELPRNVITAFGNDINILRTHMISILEGKPTTIEPGSLQAVPMTELEISRLETSVDLVSLEEADRQRELIKNSIVQVGRSEKTLPERLLSEDDRPRFKADLVAYDTAESTIRLTTIRNLGKIRDIISKSIRKRMRAQLQTEINPSSVELRKLQTAFKSILLPKNTPRERLFAAVAAQINASMHMNAYCQYLPNEQPELDENKKIRIGVVFIALNKLAENLGGQHVDVDYTQEKMSQIEAMIRKALEWPSVAIASTQSNDTILDELDVRMELAGLTN